MRTRVRTRTRTRTHRYIPTATSFSFRLTSLSHIPTYHLVIETSEDGSIDPVPKTSEVCESRVQLSLPPSDLFLPFIVISVRFAASCPTVSVSASLSLDRHRLEKRFRLRDSAGSRVPRRGGRKAKGERKRGRERGKGKGERVLDPPAFNERHFSSFPIQTV